ncbi:Prefoldin subunit 6 [Cystobasidiomycetes sp. EMM_F5]
MSVAEAQALSSEYQQIQLGECYLQKAVEARARLEAQYNENDAVEKEFNLLTPNNTIYKLIGPALIKQDPVEAKANVRKRIEFIQNEIKRVETQLQEYQTKSEEKKNRLVQLQMQAQQAQQAASGEA